MAGGALRETLQSYLQSHGAPLRQINKWRAQFEDAIRHHSGDLSPCPACSMQGLHTSRLTPLPNIGKFAASGARCAGPSSSTRIATADIRQGPPKWLKSGAVRSGACANLPTPSATHAIS